VAAQKTKKRKRARLRDPPQKRGRVAVSEKGKSCGKKKLIAAREGKKTAKKRV